MGKNNYELLQCRTTPLLRSSQLALENTDLASLPFQQDFLFLAVGVSLELRVGQDKYQVTSATFYPLERAEIYTCPSEQKYNFHFAPVTIILLS